MRPRCSRRRSRLQQLTGGVVNGKPVTPVNVLSETDKRVTVVLDDAGIYAVYLVCTHLGLHAELRHRRDHRLRRLTLGRGGARRPRAATSSRPNGWACPCHGSRYFIDSTNFYGPAPRPMDWVNIEVTPDGFFAVDRAALVATRGPGNNKRHNGACWSTRKKSNGKTLGV